MCPKYCLSFSFPFTFLKTFLKLTLKSTLEYESCSVISVLQSTLGITNETSHDDLESCHVGMKQCLEKQLEQTRSQWLLEELGSFASGCRQLAQYPRSLMEVA